MLADFGMATLLREGEFCEGRAGTQRYWAPELYDDPARLKFRLARWTVPGCTA